MSWSWIAFALLASGTSAMAQRPGGSPANPAVLEADKVRGTLERIADWQLEYPSPFPPRSWVMAPLYDGLIDASLVTGDPRYIAAVIRAGRLIAWRPGPAVYHADDVAAGHAWLRLYLMDNEKNPALLEPFKRRFDEIVAKPVKENLSFNAAPHTPGVEKTDRWTWADALYMAPPTLGVLAKATGDDRYLRFVDREFKATYDELFDPQANLFYRDSRFIGLRSPNGAKVFWSRGNAWVYAGLALFLEVLPPDYPNRAFYIDLFRRMTPAVLHAQQADGAWYPSLLDPQQVSIPETSGSALFLLGLAWGVRHGVIDGATYWPAVERGWAEIVKHVSDDGAVRFVQPVGAAPEQFDPATGVAYGTGAVLMAGAEILRALGGASSVAPSALLDRADILDAPDLSRPPGSAAAGITLPPELGGAADREYSVQVLTRIASPVLQALSRGELHERMPVHDWEKNRAAWTHYEAFARTLAGIAPWLALGPDGTPEGRTRSRFIELAQRSLVNATDPRSPDYMNFGHIPDQPLVESAYLAYALLTARRQLWDPLTASQKRHVVDALKISRGIELKHDNNWWLFPAMIEVALWTFEGNGDPAPLEAAVRKMQGWYVGDGLYSDGPTYKWDYYDSFVIHPMLLVVLRFAEEKRIALDLSLAEELVRARRYAEIQERLISPEGTFPVIGRSEAYRFGVFFHLSYMAFGHALPGTLKRAAVRGALTAVVRRMVEAPDTFDAQGWLRLGVVGHQPGVREDYNATGSLYMCLMGLQHLGLPADDPFWSDAPAPWIEQRIWTGKDVPRDRSLNEPNRGAER